MSRPSVIAVLGVPGSGKSTQAKALARSLGGTAASVGDWLRRLAADGDADARSTVEAGTPVTPSQYRRFLHAVDGGTRTGVLVLDGSPRDERHVTVLAEKLAAGGALPHVSGVLLALPTALAEARVRARRSSGAGARPDDAADVAARRIATQAAALDALVASFSSRWPLTTVDATEDPAETTRRIVASLRAEER